MWEGVIASDPGPVHVTRIEPALALNAYTVFCSCANLTGFAYDRAGADKIATDHVKAQS